MYADRVWGGSSPLTDAPWYCCQFLPKLVSSEPLRRQYNHPAQPHLNLVRGLWGGLPIVLTSCGVLGLFETNQTPIIPKGPRYCCGGGYSPKS